MSRRDENWEALTTADAVHEAMSAGREVWSQDIGMLWHKHNLPLSTTYIAYTIEAGRKYRARVEVSL